MILDDCSRPGSPRTSPGSRTAMARADDRQATSRHADAVAGRGSRGRRHLPPRWPNSGDDIRGRPRGRLRRECRRHARTVLEAARRSATDPVVVYASTNKVYGDLAGADVVEEPTRYAFRDLAEVSTRRNRSTSTRPTPARRAPADQYVRAYHRIYGLRTVVLRQSCIYGPRQLGHEEQGWLAWFMLALLQQRPLTIYGDGKQVRDLLYVDDLIDAYELAVAAIDTTAGRAYNIGGGPEHSVSVWAELGPILQRAGRRREPTRTSSHWRHGRPARVHQRHPRGGTRLRLAAAGHRRGRDRAPLAWVRDLASLR